MPRGPVTTVPGAMVFNKEPEVQTSSTDAPAKKNCATAMWEIFFGKATPQKPAASSASEPLLDSK